MENVAAEIERLRLENWQLRGALGYPVPGDIPPGDFKCGLCEARTASAASDTTVEASQEELPAAFPDIWCDNCNDIRPVDFDVMRAGRLNKYDAADMLCSKCHFVIATLHSRQERSTVNPTVKD